MLGLAWLARAWRDRDVDGLALAALAGTFFSVAFSIALAQTFAGVCLGLVAAGMGRRRIAWRWPVEAWLALAFGAVAVGSVEAGVDPHHLWAKTGKLLWFVLVPATAMLAVGPDRVRALALAFVAGCAVRGMETTAYNPWCAWRHPVPDFLTALIDKGSMTDGQMLMLGTAITVALMLLAWRSGERRLAGWLAVALLLEVAGLVVNFKRGSWFCAMVLTGVVVMAHARWRTWLVLGAVLAVLFSLPAVRLRLGQLDREFQPEGGGRLAMWTRVAPALIQAHPHGVGYGALTNDLMRKAYRHVERDRNHLHANWAQVLVETGWVGLGVYGAWMLWLAVAATRGVRHARRLGATAYAAAVAAALALAGLILNGVVEYNFGDTELMMVLAIVAGLVASVRRGDHPCF